MEAHPTAAVIGHNSRDGFMSFEKLGVGGWWVGALGL